MVCAPLVPLLRAAGYTVRAPATVRARLRATPALVPCLLAALDPLAAAFPGGHWVVEPAPDDCQARLQITIQPPPTLPLAAALAHLTAFDLAWGLPLGALTQGALLVDLAPPDGC